MAREYGNKRSSRSRGGAPHQFLIIMVIFLLGYLVASFFDFETISHWVNTQVLAHHEMKKGPTKSETPRQAVIPPKPKFEFYTLLANEKTSGSQPNTNTATTAQPASAANANPAVTTPVASAAAVPAATIKTMSSNAVASASVATQGKLSPPKTQQLAAPTRSVAVKPVTAPSSGKGNYLVQVASFKARQDAEHMKGALILRGFSVYIIPVSHPTKGNWFRVVVGPYANRGLAQQAQVSLARNERLNGMITTGG